MKWYLKQENRFAVCVDAEILRYQRGRCTVGEEAKGKYDLRKWGSSIPLGISIEYKSSKEVCWLCSKRVREWNCHGCKWCGAKYCNKCIWKTDIKKCPKCKAIEKKALDDFLG